MNRRLYTGLLACAMPLIVARLFWRSRHEPGYRLNLRERFGRYGRRLGGPVLWLHVVSVGETRAAEPLVRGLLDQYPAARLLMTHMTPGGRNAARQLYAGWMDDGRLLSVYLPYDLPWLIRRFLRWFRPVAGLLWETEIWPTLIAECQREGVPVALVNARLSARSAQRGMRLGPLMREAAAGLACVVAQGEQDAARMRAFGARSVEVVGNIKFDAAPDGALIEQGRQWRHGVDRPVVVLASTRERGGQTEEALLLGHLQQMARHAPALARALIVVVPRHPQRFEAVTAMAKALGFAVQRRTAALPTTLPADQPAVWIGDSMGELPAYYAMADVAFVGGSLLPLGAHNLIEACACGTPVVLGPHTFNFAQACEDAVEAGAACVVADVPACWQQIAALLNDGARRQAMAGAALAFAQTHRGATTRTIERLRPLLSGLAPRQS